MRVFLHRFVHSLRRMASNGDATATRSRLVVAERKRYLEMPLDEKRTKYACGEKFVTPNNVDPLRAFLLQQRRKVADDPTNSEFTGDENINSKVSFFTGDITALELLDGAIVNAANSRLLGGGGVDGAIHRAAGPALKSECAQLNGCDAGDAKLTAGYRLPATYVIHTVGPQNKDPDVLKSCYNRCFQIMIENNMKTIAFPCIATGIYGFPNLAAAQIALETSRKWLESHGNQIDQIIFCLFTSEDQVCYAKCVPKYFPVKKNVTAD